MSKLNVPWHVSFEALPVLNGYEPGYGIVFGDYDPATGGFYDTDVIIGADIVHERATMERIVNDHNRMLEIRINGPWCKTQMDAYEFPTNETIAKIYKEAK